MFSLFYGFFKFYCGKEELRLLVLGLDGAGKTVIFEQLKALYSGGPEGGGGAPLRTTPTVGLNVGQVAVGHAAVRLWDLGGLPSLRPIWDKYYATAHGVVFVVDSSAHDRLDEAKVALEGVVASPDLAEAPLLVLATKGDLGGGVSPGALAEFLSPVLKGAAASRVQPCSGLRGDGLKEAMAWLLAQLSRSPRTKMLRARERTSL